MPDTVAGKATVYAKVFRANTHAYVCAPRGIHLKGMTKFPPDVGERLLRIKVRNMRMGSSFEFMHRTMNSMRLLSVPPREPAFSDRMSVRT
jgi:hypothetical protein